MTAKEINEMVTISTRFAALNNALNIAYKAVQNVRFDAFEFTFTDADWDLINKYETLMQQKRDETTQRAAMEYILKQQEKQQS